MTTSILTMTAQVAIGSAIEPHFVPNTNSFVQNRNVAIGSAIEPHFVEDQPWEVKVAEGRNWLCNRASLRRSAEKLEVNVAKGRNWLCNRASLRLI